MIIFTFDFSRVKEIRKHGSLGYFRHPIVKGEGIDVVELVKLEPNGCIGRHGAPFNQLLMVIEGGGFVSGEDGVLLSISENQAAFWESGELSDVRTEMGLSGILIEGPAVRASLLRRRS